MSSITLKGFSSDTKLHATPRPFPEMWLVMMFDRDGNPQGYELFHPNRTAAEDKAAELRADEALGRFVFRVVSYRVVEVLP